MTKDQILTKWLHETSWDKKKWHLQLLDLLLNTGRHITHTAALMAIMQVKSFSCSLKDLSNSFEQQIPDIQSTASYTEITYG